MAKQRNHYSADFKAKVALAAIKGQQTVNEIAALYSVHPNQVLQWKKQALEALPDTFSSKRAWAAEDEEALRRPTLPADWPTQSRTRLAQKKAGLFT
jgi:transposase-like protein